MIEFVDKKKMIILCNNCQGRSKILDEFIYASTMGTRTEYKTCPICDGTGTLQLKPPITGENLIRRGNNGKD